MAVTAAKRCLRQVISLTPESGSLNREATGFYRELVRIEKIRNADETGGALAKIHEMMWKLEEHSSWKVIIDKKPGKKDGPLELLYTLVRMKGDLR